MFKVENEKKTRKKNLSLTWLTYKLRKNEHRIGITS